MGNDLEGAIALACQCHRGQVDKAGEPYILHPLRVLARVAGDAERIAAVLHDTVEDAGLELSLIRHRFGSSVADAVDALTRRENETYTAFIERCGGNDVARAVKVADIRDNLNLERLKKITLADLERSDKYRAALKRLTDRKSSGDSNA